MHYYKRNLGDYAKKAGRLSMLQHGAYTLLIDSCYDREEFPTKEQAIEWTWASSQQEIEAVEFVLSKFFELEDGRYVQNRIKEELSNFHENAAINKRIAIERETKRKENSTNRARLEHEPPPNHKPLTTNQEPITKEKPISSPKGSRLQEDIILTAKWGNEALELRKDWANDDVRIEFESFKDFWLSKAGKDGVKLDWFRTWKNWCRNSKRKGSVNE